MMFLVLGYWIFLIDPFRRRPLRRIYIKLYDNKSFLLINMCISLTLVLIQLFFKTQGKMEFGFMALPLFFIGISNVLTLYARKDINRNFLFILRGDLVSGKFVDYCFTLILLIAPFALSIVTEIVLKRYLG